MAVDPMFDSAPARPRNKWVQALRSIAIVAAYMLPLLWLWRRIDWPQSFGVTIDAHGKGALLEHWYYSYLLLKRPSLIDDVTFLYMWVPVLWFLGWLGLKTYRNAQARNGGTPRRGMPR